jgi:hypothetical protein
MKYLTIIVVVCFLILSCKERIKTNTVRTENTSFTKYLFPEDSFWYNIKRDYDTLIKFENIEKGVDSIEFRFWVDPQLLYGNNVFVFKYVNNKWISENIFFIEKIEDTSTKKFFSERLDMNIPGNYLVKRHTIDLSYGNKLPEILHTYNLKNFPTQSSIEGYKGCCLDGIVYFYEIATKKSYRFGVYENPDCCKEKLAESKIFVDFISEFKGSLPNLEYCWPMCRLVNN